MVGRLFRKKYEQLSGHVHMAENAIEVARIVASIVSSVGAERVAVAALPADLEKAVASALVDADAEVVGPLFPASELPGLIDGAQVGVTTAAFAIAETGTLVEFATDDALRLVSTLPRVHIGIVSTGKLVETLDEAAVRIRAFFSQNPKNAVVSFISGPSRTADIEMRLTLGVHGPEVAHAILIDMD